MLKNASARDLMVDARTVHNAAMARLEVGDWRDAAEKAWCAARNATEAAILEINGVDNPRSANIGAGIRGLAKERGGEWIELRGEYAQAAYLLHIEAFYGGVWHDDVPDLIRGVANYVDRIARLADEG